MRRVIKKGGDINVAMYELQKYMYITCRQLYHVIIGEIFVECIFSN